MAGGITDRNVLLGVFAVQLGLITPEQLLDALRAWKVDRRQPLEVLLVKKNLLRRQKRDLLLPLVRAHIDEHDGAVRTTGSAKVGKKGIDVQQVRASKMDVILLPELRWWI